MSKVNALGFTSVIHQDEDLGIFLAWGALTLESLRDIAQELTPTRPKDVLVVHRCSVPPEISSGELRVYGQEAKVRLHGNLNLRTCIVAEDPLLFGISRTFATYAELEVNDEQTVQFMTCKSLEQGASWLGRDPVYLNAELERLESQSG